MPESTPLSWLVLQPGASVITAEGERVGTIQHVLGDDSADVFDGLVIDTQLGPGGLKFVDAPEVAAIYDDHVTLAIDASAVESLPAPTPNPAVIENHGAEDSVSPLQHKLARAWDLISGRG